MFQTSKYISCYLSMPKGELDTAPLVSAILAAGSSPFSSQQKTRSRALHSRKGPLRPKAGHLRVGSPEDGHAPRVRPARSRFISVWSLGYPRALVRKGRQTAAKRWVSIPLHSCVPRPDISTPAFDADQRLDLIIVPSERVSRLECTSRGSRD